MKKITFVSGFMVLGIACSAFVLSFSAIRGLAELYGVPRSISFLIPVVTDFSMIAFSVAVMRAESVQESVRPFWALIILFTAVSIVLNIEHQSSLEYAGSAHRLIIAPLIASLAPISLFFSFEAFMSQVRSEAKRHTAVQSLNELHKAIETAEQKAAEIIEQADGVLNSARETAVQVVKDAEQTAVQIADDAEQKAAELIGNSERFAVQKTAEVEQMVKRAERMNETAVQFGRDDGRTAVQTAEQHADLLAYLQENPNASLRNIGAAIGRSASTVRTYTEQLMADGVLYKNGNGWEVIGG